MKDLKAEMTKEMGSIKTDISGLLANQQDETLKKTEQNFNKRLGEQAQIQLDVDQKIQNEQKEL